MRILWVVVDLTGPTEGDVVTVAETPETPTPSLAERLEAEEGHPDGGDITLGDLRAAAAQLRQLDRIRDRHHPVDEEAEIWSHHDGHDDMFPDCTVEDDCDGHTTTIQVCNECGYGHDGETPLYRAWPCPTRRLADALEADDGA